MCPEEKCNKKVTQEDNRYHCESCSKRYDRAVWTYMATCQISDHSDQVNLSMFREQAAKVIGMKADEFQIHVGQLSDDNEMNRILVPRTFHTFAGIVRAQRNVFGDTESVRYTLARVEIANPADHAQFLLNRLSSYRLKDPAEQALAGSTVDVTEFSDAGYRF